MNFTTRNLIPYPSVGDTGWGITYNANIQVADTKIAALTASNHFTQNQQIDGYGHINGALTVGGVATLSSDVLVSGAVGIGTTNPTADLEVVSTNTTAEIKINQVGVSGGFFPQLSFYRGAGVLQTTIISGCIFNSINGYQFQDINGNHTAFGCSAGTDGTLSVGFFGVTPIQRPIVTGSRSGGDALANLLAQLQRLGLITNSTVA